MYHSLRRCDVNSLKSCPLVCHRAHACKKQQRRRAQSDHEFAAAQTRRTRSPKPAGPAKCIIQRENQKGGTTRSIQVALTQSHKVAMFPWRSCCLYKQELHVRTDCEDLHRDGAFQSGSFSLLRTALIFDTDVSPSLPSRAGTSVLDTPVEDSCRSSSFFSASGQRFSDQTNIPECLNDKQIGGFRSF